MINKQLIDYIKNESQRGASMESIKNALLAIGWKDADVKKAYGSLSLSASPSKFNKKFIWSPVILLLVVAGGFLGYKFYISSSGQKLYLPVELPTTEPMAPLPEPTPLTLPQAMIPTDIPPPAPAPVISEIDKVTTIMTDICQGYLTGNNSLITANASAQTLGLISNIKLSPISSCTVNKIYQSGVNIIANLAITPLPSDKPSTELLPLSDMIFINEEDSWKFDLTASTKFATEQNKIKALAGDPEGFVDLVITGVVTSPSRPIVNKKDFKIVVTIKNMGTKTSDQGTPLTLNLEGFENGVSLSGGSYEPLLALGTTQWTWYPYNYNNLLKINDVAGQKTIKIELNPDRKITESNYENNIFTQAVQMYAK